jgi:dynactin complex subunit
MYLTGFLSIVGLINFSQYTHCCQKDFIFWKIDKERKLSRNSRVEERKPLRIPSRSAKDKAFRLSRKPL